MTARLLTILGTGPRHRVNYRAEGAEAQTSSIDGAIVKLFDVTHVTAFATEEAVRQRMADALSRTIYSETRRKPVLIPVVA